jgi:tRNA(Ile2) C34 agmatinyltransferase TiaS
MKCPNCNKEMESFAGLLWMCFDCELMLSENEINNWDDEKQYWKHNPKLL